MAKIRGSKTKKVNSVFCHDARFAARIRTALFRACDPSRILAVPIVLHAIPREPGPELRLAQKVS